jgi:eukaryotic-like serine/threonine-protein kinase
MRIGTGTGAPAAAGSAEGPLVVGEPFGTRYRILRQLGAGGMGVVYQAWDEDLGVPVALKVIRTEANSDPNLTRDIERRFKRELLLARQVTHHNVVRIYDLGDINGIKYITMSYVEGADLATIIQREGMLPTDRALRIVRGVVSGLRAAHAAGVVHRDLKPANIMIDEQDEARIMDFGIARSASLPPDTPGAPKPVDLRQNAAMVTATMQGGIVGTVEYMAPEQARGEEVDQRADIYALGLIMYDMLGGAGRAARSDSVLGELTARMQQAPPGIKTLNPAVPDPLARVIARCLEPEAKARYATTRELEADLNRLDDQGKLLPVLRRVSTRQIVAAAIMTAILLVGTWWVSRPEPVVVQPPTTSVLITDFKNETGDSVFDGLLEQPLAVGIEVAPFIHTFPRRDALRLAERLKPGSALDEEMGRLVSRSQGINVILVGSVKRARSGYELTVRAIDAATDQERASLSERASDKQGVLAAAGALAEEVREALGDTPAKSGQHADVETFTASSLDAVKSYSTAQDLMARGRYEESIVYYKRAVEQDPNLGRAYSGWGTSAYFLGRSDEAERVLLKAVQRLDRMTEREKYRTQGAYYFIATQNFPKAIENYTEMVQRYPADLAAQNNLAYAHFSLLNFAKALEHGGKALDIYPKNVIIRSNYALYAMYAGDFATAAAEAPKVIDIDKTFHKAYLVQAMAAMADGKPDAARAAYDKMATESDATGALVASLGLADIAMYYGKWDEAERLLEQSLPKDREAKNLATLGAKLIALSEVYAHRNRSGDQSKAVRAAMEALTLESNSIAAGISLARLGRAAEASAVAQKLAATGQEQNRAYAGIIEGNLALRRNAASDAIDALTAAKGRADLWLARLGLGIGYVQRGLFVEALAELEACEKRRGEATAVFLDDLPTFRYLSELPYWKGRAQQGLGSPAAGDSFRAFLALREGSTGADPLVADARTRLKQ